LPSVKSVKLRKLGAIMVVHQSAVMESQPKELMMERNQVVMVESQAVMARNQAMMARNQAVMARNQAMMERSQVVTAKRMTNPKNQYAVTIKPQHAVMAKKLRMANAVITKNQPNAQMESLQNHLMKCLLMLRKSGKITISRLASLSVAPIRRHLHVLIKAKFKDQLRKEEK